MSTQWDWVNFVLQRPNYFPGQYLLDEDFELAHRYLSDRLRYINSRLHLAGIVEGLEVEAIAGQPEIIIKAGSAIDGEGNLVILPQAVTRKIKGLGWLCLRYHQEPKVLQQPEIPDSFTRFEETPLLTLEAIESKDLQTITLAKVSLDEGQVTIDTTMRQYSGVRLPNSGEAMGLRADSNGLTIQGNLTVSGALQLSHSLLAAISQSIALDEDRSDVIPSEKAVKEHINRRINDRLASLNAPTQEQSSVRLTTKDGKTIGWKTEGGPANDPTAWIELISTQDNRDQSRLIVMRDSGNVGVGVTNPGAALDVNGVIRAVHLELSNPMRHRMYPNNPIIYQDIFEAEKAGAIAKSDDLPVSSYDNKTYAAKGSYWGRKAIRYGIGKEDKGGAIFTLPPGYDTVWIRIANSREWHIVNAQFSSDGKTFQDLGNWTAGYRQGNQYCPDGSLGDSSRPFHQWLPIPIGQSGQVKLVHKGDTGNWMMLSGVAFSQNPWGHAAQSAVGYHWADRVNQGDPVLWESNSWNDDILGCFDNLCTYDIRVPVVPSGRDKLLYLINHNDTWNGCLHTGLSIKIGNEYVPIERFLASYDNPFARHWNSRFYNRYIAACISADLIAKALPNSQPGDRTTQLITIKVDLSLQQEASKDFEDRIYFREIGSHDLEVPFLNPLTSEE
ncbi:hypothetical protein K4A83_12960 [Spirulina subsalsa FACHB-351]|uniref:Uncharacterized protein n=1 Tax=Spirulina subsalsa FACHB-351 TaxID=234711 RepID=A0ABT3L6U5_9CYAN|nr:hypothetical protein [Spirulina subsalsa]MCW6037172.1 hypothetical protein [Spirulina subsalsa FACHB-351]